MPVLFNLAVTLEELGRSVEALPLYRIACSLSPNDARPQGQLDACLLVLSRFPEALQASEQCIALDDRSELAWRVRGQACAALGRLADMREALERALAIAPDNREVRNRLPIGCLWARPPSRRGGGQ